ncbi:MAG: N-acetylglucosamine-6-phosphate deacetylase [Clostridia bacterium]|nr:N-acetylglucosamine-6-phosphate deacetylase [Clostridia bacterium]
MIRKLYNGKIILGDTLAPSGSAVYTEGDKIIAVTDEALRFDEEYDAEGKYISAGFIDIHVHGGFGYRFEDCSEEEFFIVAEKHAEHGTTCMLPSISTRTTEQYIAMLERFKGVKTCEDPRGAYLYGIHMESPYFSPAQTGAQSNLIRDFDKAEYTMLIDRYGEYIKRWSAAPELCGVEDFAKACRDAGILLSIGHSDAEYDTVMSAYDMGFSCVTHLYSCTSTVHRKNAFRYAGIVEAAYMLDGMDVELIADGKHLPESLLKFAVKFKGIDRIAIVTDATRYAGYPDGAEKIYGFTDAIIEDGVAKKPDRSCFTGSCATADRLVRTMMDMGGLSLLDAVRLITVNPARIAGIEGRGRLEKGAYADVTVFDDDINVSLTMVNGNIVYKA